MVISYEKLTNKGMRRYFSNSIYHII